MGYTTPTTRASGYLVTAATWNAEIVDNQNAAFPLGVDAWSTYTPTLVQSGAVTKTATYAKYQRVGRLITVQIKLDVTGPGTAANTVTVGLPVAAVIGANACIGSGFIYDASANLFYGGIARKDGADTFSFVPTSTDSATQLGVSVFTAALAASDIVGATVTYEAVS